MTDSTLEECHSEFLKWREQALTLSGGSIFHLVNLPMMDLLMLMNREAAETEAQLHVQEEDEEGEDGEEEQEDWWLEGIIPWSPSIAEIEALEACKWLRAAGFPQYAQMYEEHQFPVDVNAVEKDHDFLDCDSIQSLFRRLNTLNKCASMKIDGPPPKTVDDSDEEDQCALSDKWKYQRSSRRWSRLDLNDFLQPVSVDDSTTDRSTGVRSSSSHDSVITDNEESLSQLDDSPGARSKSGHGSPYALKVDCDSRGGASPSPSPVNYTNSTTTTTSGHASDSENSNQSFSGGALSPGLRRAASSKLRGAKDAFFKRMESLKTRRGSKKGRLPQQQPGTRMEIGNPVVMDASSFQEKIDRMGCKDISPSSELPPGGDKDKDLWGNAGSEVNADANQVHINGSVSQNGLSSSHHPPATTPTTQWRNHSSADVRDIYSLDSEPQSESCPKLVSNGYIETSNGGLLHSRTGSFNMGGASSERHVDEVVYRKKRKSSATVEPANRDDASTETLTNQNADNDEVFQPAPVTEHRLSVYDNVPLCPAMVKDPQQELDRILQELLQNINGLNQSLGQTQEDCFCLDQFDLMGNSISSGSCHKKKKEDATCLDVDSGFRDLTQASSTLAPEVSTGLYSGDTHLGLDLSQGSCGVTTAKCSDEDEPFTVEITAIASAGGNGEASLPNIHSQGERALSQGATSAQVETAPANIAGRDVAEPVQDITQASQAPPSDQDNNHHVLQQSSDGTPTTSHISDSLGEKEYPCDNYQRAIDSVQFIDESTRSRSDNSEHSVVSQTSVQRDTSETSGVTSQHEHAGATNVHSTDSAHRTVPYSEGTCVVDMVVVTEGGPDANPDGSPTLAGALLHHIPTQDSDTSDVFSQSSPSPNQRRLPISSSENDHVSGSGGSISNADISDTDTPGSREEDGSDHTGEHPEGRERRDSGVGSSLTRAPSDRRRHRIRWHSFVKSHRPSFNSRVLQINGMSAGQLNVLRRLSLLKITALMERYSPSNRSGWNWIMPKFIKRLKTPDYRDKNVFGVPLLMILQRTGQPLPQCVLYAMRCLRRTATDAVGIFRKSGVRSRIQKLRNEIEAKPESVDFESLQAYDVADLLKQYFRELPECLLTNKLSETFISVFIHVPNDQRQDALQWAIMLLPDENREVLQSLLLFLGDMAQHSDQNQMNASNLAVCFAPSLFNIYGPRANPAASPKRNRKMSGVPEQRELQEQKAAHLCLTQMILNSKKLFMVPEEMLGKCRLSYLEQGDPVTLGELGKRRPEDESPDHTAYMESCIQGLLKESRDRFKGWVSVSNSHPCELAYKKVGDGHPLRLWKCSVDVEAPPMEVLNRILRERHLWDEDLLEWRVVEKMDAQTEVFQYVVSSMAPHPTRDFCELRSWRVDLPKGACVLVSTSVEHQEAPLLGGVRAVILASRYLIEPCGSGKSRLTHITRVDVRGHSPEWFNKAYGHICACYVSRIRDSFKVALTDGPETKV